MRKLIVGAFVSLDGVMQAPGGPEEDPTGGFKHGGWVVPHIDDDFGKSIDQLFFSRPFELLLGRRTYDIFSAHWPYQDDEIGRAFNATTKYVATRSDTPLTWKGSVALHDAAKDVARLKKEDGPPLITQGSTNLIQTLLAHDLVDEFFILTFPVILGRGKRLFGDGAKPAGLKLNQVSTTSAGVVVSSFTRAGPALTADITPETPTEAELARREKLKREG